MFCALSRLYLMFMGPLEAVKPWQSTQIAGMHRFRDKIYSVVANNSDALYSEDCPADLKKDMHKTVKKVTEDIEKMSFNTAISHLMVFLNKLQAIPAPKPRVCLETFVALVHPFAPHVAEECWEILQSSSSSSSNNNNKDDVQVNDTGIVVKNNKALIGLSKHPWPTYDPELCIESVVTVGVKVNGKVRGNIEISVDSSQEQAVALAKGIGRIGKYLEGIDLAKAKVVYVPGRILSITNTSE